MEELKQIKEKVQEKIMKFLNCVSNTRFVLKHALNFKN